MAYHGICIVSASVSEAVETIGTEVALQNLPRLVTSQSIPSVALAVRSQFGSFHILRLTDHLLLAQEECGDQSISYIFLYTTSYYHHLPSI